MERRRETYVKGDFTTHRHPLASPTTAYKSPRPSRPWDLAVTASTPRLALGKGRPREETRDMAQGATQEETNHFVLTMGSFACRRCETCRLFHVTRSCRVILVWHHTRTMTFHSRTLHFTAALTIKCARQIKATHCKAAASHDKQQHHTQLQTLSLIHI